MTQPAYAVARTAAPKVAEHLRLHRAKAPDVDGVAVADLLPDASVIEALGAVNYDGHKRGKFLDIQLGPERGAYAEDTAKLIDSEVKRIMTGAHDEARRILSKRRDMLEAVTRRLLEKEVMEGDKLRRILNAPPAPHDPMADTTPLPPLAD